MTHIEQFCWSTLIKFSGQVTLGGLFTQVPGSRSVLGSRFAGSCVKLRAQERRVADFSPWSSRGDRRQR
jgi:hypothetical protein